MRHKKIFNNHGACPASRAARGASCRSSAKKRCTHPRAVRAWSPAPPPAAACGGVRAAALGLAGVGGAPATSLGKSSRMVFHRAVLTARGLKPGGSASRQCGQRRRRSAASAALRHLRQKLCPHVVVTGRTHTSRHTQQVTSSRTWLMHASLRTRGTGEGEGGRVMTGCWCKKRMAGPGRRRQAGAKQAGARDASGYTITIVPSLALFYICDALGGCHACGAVVWGSGCSRCSCAVLLALAVCVSTLASRPTHLARPASSAGQVAPPFYRLPQSTQFLPPARHAVPAPPLSASVAASSTPQTCTRWLASWRPVLAWSWRPLPAARCLAADRRLHPRAAQQQANLPPSGLSSTRVMLLSGTAR